MITHQYKCLGVYIDSYMNWKFHLNHILNKLRAFILLLYKLRHTISQQYLINILKIKIIPIICYAIEIYGNDYYTNQLNNYIKKTIIIIIKGYIHK